MIIRHYGSGYKIGDVIGNSAGSVQLGVTKIGVNPATNEDGAILEVTVFDRGRSIEAAQSMNSGELVTPSTAAGVSITNIAANGQKFSAYFPHSYIYEDIATDQKPTLVNSNEGRITKLTKDINSTPTKQINVLGGERGYFGLTTGQKLTSINIDPTQRASDSKYDIFFHFQNDVSHTWISNEFGAVRFPEGLVSVCEQYVDLKISTI